MIQSDCGCLSYSFNIRLDDARCARSMKAPKKTEAADGFRLEKNRMDRAARVQDLKCMVCA